MTVSAARGRNAVQLHRRNAIAGRADETTGNCDAALLCEAACLIAFHDHVQGITIGGCSAGRQTYPNAATAHDADVLVVQDVEFPLQILLAVETVESDFQDTIKMENFFREIYNTDHFVAVTFSMLEEITVAPVASVSSLQDISDTVYKKTVPVDVVFTTSTYNKIYNLPMSSGDWFDSSEINKTLCMVVNKAAQNYFDTSYAVGNVESSLSLTPFNVVGTVNDGTDIPTVYLDAHSIELLVPNMWKVKNATVHWHSEAGITMRQMYSSLHDILEDTIGGNLDIIGKSDIGDTYNSVLSVLQLGLLVTSFLLLFVSVLGQINIGLSSLEQRTHELLIRRAIGASRANIVTLVLGAQLTISVFVCIVSILISFFLVQGMGLFLPVDSPVAALEYPILSAVVAVITSVVVALLGGLLPALKAAKLEPALALR